MDRDAELRSVTERWGKALRRIARVYGGEHGDEEDLHQEILLQIWRALPSFRGDSSMGTWVYRIALNTGLKHRRKARRRPRLDAEPPEVPSRGIADGTREERILRDFLSGLGPVDQAVLTLYMEGLPHAEIAEVTGLSCGAVAVRVHRMKQAFETRYVE